MSNFFPNFTYSYLVSRIWMTFICFFIFGESLYSCYRLINFHNSLITKSTLTVKPIGKKFSTENLYVRFYKYLLYYPNP